MTPSVSYQITGLLKSLSCQGGLLALRGRRILPASFACLESTLPFLNWETKEFGRGKGELINIPSGPKTGCGGRRRQDPFNSVSFVLSEPRLYLVVDNARAKTETREAQTMSERSQTGEPIRSCSLFMNKKKTTIQVF